MKLETLFKIIIAVLLILLVTITLFFSAGFAWPDEIFQTIEPAHFILTGKGHLGWEFFFKVRSVLYSYTLAFFIFIIRLFSDSSIVLYYSLRVLVSIPFVYSSYLLYLSFSKVVVEKKETLQYLKPVFFFFFWMLTPILYHFGFRTLTESITTSLILISIFTLEYFPETLNKNKIFYFSFIIGLCYGFRFQTGIFSIVFYPLFIFQLYKQKKISWIFIFIIGAFVGLLFYAISDYVYYGIPFITTYRYLEYNLVKKISHNWGVSPFYFYLLAYIKYLEAFCLFSILGMTLHFKKHFALISGLIFYIFIHSLIAHKELRFIYFTFPILCFYSMIGIWYIFGLIRINYPKYSMLFLGIILVYSISINLRSLKKIDWNYANPSLQTFFEISKLHLKKENILFGIYDNFAWWAGYVYIGKDYKGNLFYHDLKYMKEKKISKILKKNKINYLLVEKLDFDRFCTKHFFCDKIISVENYYLLKRKMNRENNQSYFKIIPKSIPMGI